MMKKFLTIRLGETAAEIIYYRVDSGKDFMGLMTFSGDQPTLREAKIAKNYLNEKEYKKYKSKTLSSVERDYLNSIKQLEQKGKKQ